MPEAGTLIQNAGRTLQPVLCAEKPLGTRLAGHGRPPAMPSAGTGCVCAKTRVTPCSWDQVTWLQLLPGHTYWRHRCLLDKALLLTSLLRQPPHLGSRAVRQRKDSLDIWKHERPSIQPPNSPCSFFWEQDLSPFSKLQSQSDVPSSLTRLRVEKPEFCSH